VTDMLASSGGLGSEHERTGRIPAGRRTGCPLCGGDDERMFCRTRDFNWAVPGEFTYVMCTGCGLVRQNPAPSDETLRIMYPPYYGTSLGRDENPERKINAPPFAFRADVLETFVQPPASLLDIGCGIGFFLAFMRRRGWDVNGIEPAAEHVECARQILGLEGVHRGAWPSESFNGMNVDVVSLFHVLEHFSDPVEALQRTRGLMKPHALLMIETPNAECWQMSLFGKHCLHLDAPRHLCLLSPGTLRRCVEKAGFETMFLRTYAPSTIEWTESLRYVVRAWGLRRYESKASRGKNGTGASGSYAPCGETGGRTILDGLHGFERLLCRGANRLSEMAGRGANLLLVARRR
jgi:SAM-dependent methyltransferase